MKKGFFITAIFALCGLSMADDVSADLLQGATVSGNKATVNIGSLNSKVTKKDKFVFSFKLSNDGIAFLNSWRGNKELDVTTDQQVLATFKLADGTASSQFAVAFTGTGKGTTPGAYVPQNGYFILLSSTEIGDDFSARLDSLAISRTKEGKTVRYPVDGASYISGHGAIADVAITLSSTDAGLYSLNALVTYADSTVIDFSGTTTTSKNVNVDWTNVTGWDSLTFNTDYVDYTSAYLSDSENGDNLLKAKSPATPEPATATLSLLALAGLATRRKRK